jgi:hypothetical protein
VPTRAALKRGVILPPRAERGARARRTDAPAAAAAAAAAPAAAAAAAAAAADADADTSAARICPCSPHRRAGPHPLLLLLVLAPLVRPSGCGARSEITPEGTKVTRLEQILLNGNNVCLMVPGGDPAAAVVTKGGALATPGAQ